MKNCETPKYFLKLKVKDVKDFPENWSAKFVIMLMFANIGASEASCIFFGDFRDGRTDGHYST